MAGSRTFAEQVLQFNAQIANESLVLPNGFETSIHLKGISRN